MKALPSILIAIGITSIACSGEQDGKSDAEFAATGVVAPPPGNIIITPTSSGGSPRPNASSGGGVVPQTSAQACGQSRSALSAVPVTLELLVDTSRSMLDTPNGDRNGESKWEITRSALSALEPTLSADLELGLIFYPGTGSTGSDCLAKRQAVEVANLGAAGSATRTAFQAALDRARPDGGTPTQDAYEFGVERLLAADGPGEKYLLLITDGIPTFEQGCQNFNFDGVDTAPLIDAATQAFAQGVHTFVIGSPGSENARTSLSKIARAGGTATDGCNDDGPNFCHFDMTQNDDLGGALTAAFGTITESIASCDYQIPTDVANLDPSRVNVLLETAGGEVSVGRDPSEQDCTTGWQYSADRTSIVLCADTCERIHAEPDTRVQILFGCQTQIAPTPGLQ